MGKILCATRGGEASYRTQDAAIALAKELGYTLVFLYVVDLHFLDKVSAPLVVDVEGELGKMGEFLLLMAKERAAEHGIAAETMWRKGRVREVLKQLAQKEGISLLVLGRPAGAESAFELAGLRALSAEIEAETGVETRII
ncbi:MAG: universal stress protein [Anaerolineae bacterium]|jgi:nucleotide-binding universal stress UspA family protein